jgi:hypothetical protein
MDTMLVVGRVGFVVDLIDQTSVHLDQSGTENSPFIVKIQPTPKTQAEADQETKDRLEKTAYDWNILFLNALLVSVAFPQFIAISIQAIFLWLAFRATKKSADVAEASLVKLERAFVLPKEFFVRWHWHLISEPRTYFWRIRRIYENSGSTPTIDLVTNLNRGCSTNRFRVIHFSLSE